MKTALLIASGLCLAMLATVGAPGPAQALTMKECSAKYKEAKTAGTLNGMKWNDFRKAQCGAEAAGEPAAPPPAPPPAAAPPPPPPPAASTAAPAGKPATGSPGRQAMYARERACGKEWKADKAAGKIPAGQKWPQYWHQCDERKKAQGM
jgi:hypothetical protein